MRIRLHLGRVVNCRYFQSTQLLLDLVYIQQSKAEFSVAKLVEESKEGRSNQVITRISFVPESLEKEMCLVFVMG